MHRTALDEEMAMGERSDFLYARPSFLSGMARVLDLGATLREFNSSLIPEQADAIALRTDWAIIGNDIRGVAATVERELGEQS